ncbi:crossover junction endonuclease MUS81 [Plasmodium gonderi]|uniref:Crossover junction endonuclease MUS81 n=1 Tax=Plasmodium gonderi TaxID=77519 RepID=A0A1Y1JQ77_PLAGO|nr:crossover junction endonuclease MUS81 [Plasmodium gonderi]GAW82593.1 crossover junction endonuclease MUS81 [Plasmodium gonderi]
MEEGSYLKRLASRKTRRNFSIHPENAIFYDYFNNLKRKAMAQGNTNLVISFKKIMSSILMYPLPIKNSLDAYKLKGVGKQFSFYFEKALKQYAGDGEKKNNNIHDDHASSNGSTSNIYNHINKVITSVNRFLKELDNEVYNVKLIGEESDDSILRNIKEIKNDYLNSNHKKRGGNMDVQKNEKEKKKNKINKGKKAIPRNSDGSDGDRGTHHNLQTDNPKLEGNHKFNEDNKIYNLLYCTSNSHAYMNRAKLNDYTVISGKPINGENSIGVDEKKLSKKLDHFSSPSSFSSTSSSSPNEQEKRKRFTGKNKEIKKIKEIELNPFEKNIMRFLERYGDLYNDCAVSMEEITIGFLKYYQNTEKVNFRKLSRLIKLQFIEKVEIYESKAVVSGRMVLVPKTCTLDESNNTITNFSSTSNVFSPLSVSNSKKSKLKIINKVKLTTKGREFMHKEKKDREEKDRVVYEQSGCACIHTHAHIGNEKSNELATDVFEEEFKSMDTEGEEIKMNESNKKIKSEDSFKSVEYLSEKMNEYEEQLRREVTCSDTENNYKFENDIIIHEKKFDDYFFLKQGPNEDKANSLFLQDKQIEKEEKNTKNEYSQMESPCSSENANSNDSVDKNCNIPFESAKKDQLDDDHTYRENDYNIQWGARQNSEHVINEWSNAHNSYSATTKPWREEKNDLINFELKLERKKEEIRKNLKISLREKVQKQKNKTMSLFGYEDQSTSNNFNESQKSQPLNSSLYEKRNIHENKQEIVCTQGSINLLNIGSLNGNDLKNMKIKLFDISEGGKIDKCKVDSALEGVADVEEPFYIKQINEVRTCSHDHTISEDICVSVCENVFEDSFFTIGCDQKEEKERQNCNEEDNDKCGENEWPKHDNIETNICQTKKIIQCKQFDTIEERNLFMNEAAYNDDVIDLSSEKHLCENRQDGSDAYEYGNLFKKKEKGRTNTSCDKMEHDSYPGSVVMELGNETKGRGKKRKKHLDEEVKEYHVREKRTKKKERKKMKNNKLFPNIYPNIHASVEPSIDTHPNRTNNVTYGSYEIVMVIDNRDISGFGKELNEKMKKIFARNNIKYITRNLPLGDIIWLCRRKVYNGNVSKKKSKSKRNKSMLVEHNELSGEGTLMNDMSNSNTYYCSRSYDKNGDSKNGDNKNEDEENGEYEEHVLKWIVERKTLNDLSASIIDGRYEEQKYRLMRSKGMSHIIYLIENSNNSFKNYTNTTRISYETLSNAQHSIQLVSGFSILTSQNTKHTFFLLAEMHAEIVKNIHRFCNVKENEYIMNTDNITIYLKDNSSGWEQWNNESKKSKNNLVKEVFGKQLRLINMCGPDATELILSLWPTPIKLNMALSRYTHDGILAEKIRQIYLKDRDLLRKRRVKCPVDTNLIAQLRQMYAPDSF